MPRNRSRIPYALTPLLGRARELDETTRLLGAARLLTITGAGGSGKTRLAQELAHRVQNEYEDAVWVELAPLSEPDLIGQQILDAMGVREHAAEDVLRVVLHSIRDRRTLLVLDNCEHLVDASATVAEEILRSCPNTTIVTTTREALGVRGEQVWLVPPLSLEDAVQLFTERARLVAPSFEPDATVEQICRRLDGIPLAIELAAARVKVLAVDEIAARLDDAFRLLSSGSRTLPRHRTIRETIDWSYRLLSPDEQVLLRRLAVFATSFSLADAEAICAHAGNARSSHSEMLRSAERDKSLDVLTHLSALVDKSLVIAESSRYRMLDTVRQYAAEKLAAAGENDALRERHARHFLALVEELEPRLFAGAVDPGALAKIDQEIGNIRAIFDSGVSSELELRLLYALHWYWFARAHFHEGRRRMLTALDEGGGRPARPAPGVAPAASAQHHAPRNSAGTATLPELVLAKARVAAATTAVWQGDWTAVQAYVGPAVEVLRGTNELRPLANALMLQASAYAFANDHAAAIETFEDAEAVARRNGRDVLLSLTLYWKATAAELRGDFKTARAAFAEAHEIGVATNNKPATAHPLTGLGYVALHEGKREEAIRAFRTALEIHAELDDRWGLTQVVEGIGLTLLEAREAETGTRLLAAASAAWLQLGARPGRDEAYEESKNARIREALGDDRLRIVLASGAAMAYDSMVALAREQVAQLGVPHHAPLRVQALGPLEIYREGQHVEESARARELLLYLLCYPAGRTKEQIGAALWPDADPAKLRNNFHVTMHRLRKALGAAEWIVVDGDTYALDRSRGAELDAEIFDREANAAIRAKNVERLEKAVELYRGDFFENASSGEWYLEQRDRLRELYAKALDTLGRTRMAAGDYTAAAEAYQKLVALDDLDEDAARSLMQALEKSGDAAGAKRAYRRLADALKRELGETPSF